MRRFGLRDGQWERIAALLPGRPGHVGVTAEDNRLFVEAVLYRYRAGIPWRDLPERFGDRKNVHRRHSRWSKSVLWKTVFVQLMLSTWLRVRWRKRRGAGAFCTLDHTDRPERNAVRCIGSNTGGLARRWPVLDRSSFFVVT
jgi:transposase